jgi:hypothetical protein
MKRNYYILGAVCGAFALAASLSGCKSVLNDNENADDVMMQLNMSSTSESTTSKALSRADAATYPGRLLFWQKGKALGSYHYSDVDNLNSYNANTAGTNKFNTGYPYPSDGSFVYAAGYSPISGVTASDGYETLTVSSNIGLVDVLTSRTPLTGSKDNEFTDDLNFDHTLVKVTFKAKYDYTMYKIRQVQNIRVTIPKAYLPTQWTWSDTNKKYEVSANGATDNLTLSFPNTLSDQDTEYVIGTCYLNLPTDNTGKLTPITLKCDLYKFDQASVFTKDKTYDNMTLQLKTDDGITNVKQANAGDAFDVVFLFSNDTWTLTAVKKPWQNGGLITIPVDPAGN